MKKWGVYLFLLLVLTILSLKTIYSLGVIPGKMSINFEPNLKTKIVYEILEDNPERELEIYADGDLAKYVEFNTKKLVGSGKFIVSINLPDKIEKPGQNLIYIRVKEKVDEELASAVGTSVSIGALIIINVPYPGRYLSLTLDSENVNVGEPIEFTLSVTSKGTETVFVQPKIEINSEDKLIETLDLNVREIKSQEELKLKKTLDTTGYNPGKYKAVAIVDYGEIAKAESDFKIGDLVINIINATKKITIGGIKPYEIGIESGWNNNIDGVYAQITILDGLNPIFDFKTETAELVPWEQKIIRGYFDTSNFTKGIYNSSITLIYYGKDQGRSTSKLMEVEFVEGINITLIAIIAGIVILVIAIFVVKKYFWRENGKKKK